MTKVSIPNVVGGLLKLPDGRAVVLESVEGFQLLANPDFRSFRFEDTFYPYTCRKEKVKGIDGYWYGYQRGGGKVIKRYIGKTSDLSHERLVEVSDRFHQMPTPRSSLPKSALATSSKLGNNSTISALPKRLGNKAKTLEVIIHMTEPVDLSGNLLSDLPSNLLGELNAELAQLKADNERLRQELNECRQELDSCQRLRTETQAALEPAKLLNKLRQQNKRTKVTLRDLEDIVGLIAGD